MRRILKRRVGESETALKKRILADCQASQRRPGTRGKLSAMSSVKPGWRVCEFPGCSKEAKYMGERKDIRHYFCFPHFQEYYGKNNI